MRKELIFLVFFTLITLFFPFQKAFAHASLAEETPDSQSTFDEKIDSIRLRFSERPDPQASKVKVTDPEGNTHDAQNIQIDQQNPYILTANISLSNPGTYVIGWEVLSTDDGHWTSGAYVIHYKEQTRNLQATVTRIDYSSSPLEAFTICLGILGESLILGALALLLLTKTSNNLKKRIRRILILASAITFLGGLLYIGYKSQGLEGSYFNSLTTFVPTITGQFALLRAILAVFFLAITLFGNINRRFPQILLLLLIAGMLFTSTRISHAAASAFIPEISVTINYFHLLFKGLWTGGIIVFTTCVLPLTKKEHLITYSNWIEKITILCFCIGGVTGVYIIWLHLKDFSNILTSDWGIRFVVLSLTTAGLVGVRIWSMYQARRGKIILGMYRLESLFALAVLAVTSLLIITTPPLPTNSFNSIKRDDGVTITMQENLYNENQLLINFKEDEINVKDITNVVITAESDSVPNPIILNPIPYIDSFTLEKNIFTDGKWKTKIVGQRSEKKDAISEFEFEVNDEKILSEKNIWNDFTFIMIGQAIMIVALSASALWFLKRRNPKSLELIKEHGVRQFSFFLIFTVSIICIYLIRQQILRTPFEKLCTSNGHHFVYMTPHYEGRELSKVPTYGCAFGQNEFIYMYPNEQEYKYITRDRSPQVDLARGISSSSGIEPETLEFQLTGEDNTPLQGLTIMNDSILHVLMVPEDLSHLVHLTPERISATSTNLNDDGVLWVEYDFPLRQRQYIIAASYTLGGIEHIDHKTFRVKGKPEQSKQLLNISNVHTEGIYKFTLHRPPTITSGVKYAFQLTTRQNGEDVANLTPVYSSLAYIVAVKEDLSEIITADGYASNSAIEKIIDREKSELDKLYVPAQFGPIIDFEIMFPTSGIYQIFIELGHGNKTLTPYFSVEVKS